MNVDLIFWYSNKKKMAILKIQNVSDFKGIKIVINAFVKKIIQNILS